MGSIGGKWDSNNKREFTFYQISTNVVRLFYSPDGIIERNVDFAVQLGWNELEYHFLNGVLSYTLNGVSGQHNLAFTEIFQGDARITILAQTNGLFVLDADLAYFKQGDAEYNCSEGGLCDVLINVGTAGGNASIFNANIPNLRAGKQNIIHYNLRNKVDVYTNGVIGQEVYIPSGKAFSQAGYTFLETREAGRFHNNTESFIQLPATLYPQHLIAFFASLTNNKMLKWGNGEIIDYTILVAAGGEVSKTALGNTRLFCPVAGLAYFASLRLNVETGVNYRYHIEVLENNSGSSYVNLGGAILALNAPGVYEGVLTAVNNTSFRIQDDANPTDMTFGKVVIWKDGEIPPLSYREMETDFDEANIAFMSTEENKHKQFLIYKSPVVNLQYYLRIQDCLKWANNQFALRNEENGALIVDEETGIILEGDANGF